MADVTEQIVRESPEIEAYKLNMMKAAAALKPPELPQYQIAGFTPQQTAALQAGQQGIGAYTPYLQAGQQALGTGTATMGEAADVLRGADTRGQFAAAQQAYNLAAQPAAAIGNLANTAGAGIGYLGAAGRGIDTAQQMAAQSAYQPGFQQGIGALYGAAGQAQQAAQLGRAPTVASERVGTPLMNAAQMGPAQQITTQSFAAPGSAQAYMSPYMQAVVNAQQREATRASDIQKQQNQAAAVQSGAFGGSRQGIVEAERQRNLATQLGDIQSAGLQSAYQQAQQQFNAEQQARLAAQQANQQAGLTVGGQNLSAQQQAAVQNQAAQLQAQGLNAQQAMQAALANQQTQAQYGIQGAQLGLQAADALRQAGLGEMQGAAQQGQLAQGAAGVYGQLAGQQAGLAGQYAGIAGQQANILGQQSQLQQQLGQGIGNLAGQQFGIGSQMASQLGALGGQMGQMGMQQAALGQTAQQLGQGDVNFLYNLGSQQQKQQQAVLDAQRASAMQTALQPYQQLAFQSDIYKGAPSSQMAISSQQTPTPSPFQQIAGVGTGILGLAGAANSASKLF